MSQIRLVAVLTLAGCLSGAAADADGVERYVRFAYEGKTAYGKLERDTVHELAGPPYDSVDRTGRTLPLADIKLLAPSEPTKVIAVALNFRSHAGSSAPAQPELFAKFPSSLLATEEPIVVPPGSLALHYEGELVVIIGKRARRISEKDAPAHIFAVTAGNDISERSWQGTDMQWLRAKASDGFAPAGPAMVTGLDYNDLTVETWVDGDVRQSESTKALIHSIDRIVSYASQYFTLMPGDMIFTGTPGKTQTMRPGELVEVSVEGVGVLRNRVAGPGGASKEQILEIPDADD